MPNYDKKGNALRGKRKKCTKRDDTYSIWDNPNSTLNSQWGHVTYRVWCRKEKERLAERGKFVEILTAEDGEIALAEIKKEE